MSTAQKKNRKIGNIKTVIYGRTAMILVGFLAQLTALAVGYLLLRSYSIGFYGVFLVVSAVAVVRIFNVGDNPDMKLSWMLPMALFPVFGAIFYMTIVTQPGTKVMYQKLKELAGCTAKYVVSDAGVWDRLRAESPHMGQLARYLYCYDNSPAYENTQVKYFPLGDEQFPAMLEELRKAEKYIFMEFFIVSEGRVWDTILDILREKAAQGVEVRFMYDGTCVLFNLPAYYSEILEEDGIR